MQPSRQPSLFTRKLVDAGSDAVEALVADLRGRGWVTAKVLSEDGYADRHLRAIAASSQGRILGGQKGYCLTAEASVEDVQHCIAFYRSQARAMEQRAYQTERAMHQRRTA